jgi:hypothetical protein
MTLPTYFGLGFSADDAQRVRQLLIEAAPYCEQCARILKLVDAQLATLNGTPLPPEPGSCSNC